MILFHRDDLDRTRFDWPQPLVIDLICDHHAGIIPAERRLEAAKLHEQALRADLQDGDAEAAPLRSRLSALYATHGIGSDVIARIDRAVVSELMRLVEVRFRHSPRLLEAYARRLQAVLTEIVGGPVVAVSRPEWTGRSPAFRAAAGSSWQPTAMSGSGSF